MSKELDQRGPEAYLAFTVKGEELPLGAQLDSGTSVQRALAVARITSEVLGARRSSEPFEFSPSPEGPPNRAGATTVHLDQQVRGIPVFQAGQSVRFSRSGEVRRTQARLVDRAGSFEVSLKVTASAAFVTAARHVTATDDGADGTTLFPEILASFPQLPSQPTVFARGPFTDPVTAHLTWFPGAEELRLAWDLVIGVSEQEGAFRILVDAHDEKVLFCGQLVPAATSRGSVFQFNPGTPRTVVNFPLSWQSYGLTVPADLPPAPPDWVADTGTTGYAATSGVGSSGPPLVGPVVDGVVTFNPANPQDQDQQVLNAFYGACFMHDLTYLLGFRESEGNYQEGSAGTAGHPAGRVKVEVRSQPIQGLAHWWPLGSVPTIRLGPKTETGRHTALDMSIVFHEYMHGVSTRLVGGGTKPHPLQEQQSRGMGEGWGDYVACTILDSPIFGEWVSGSAQGLRRFPYDDDFPADQIGFGTLGTLRLYDIGSLWCAVLLRMNRAIGRGLGLLLVLESMKNLAADPSLLDGRDELLLVLDDLRDSGEMPTADHAAAKKGIWDAFAAFGMGVGANCQGPSVIGAVADSTVP